MSNDAKVLLGIILAAAIFTGGYWIGGKGSCKCSETQQQGHTSPQLKPIKVP